MTPAPGGQAEPKVVDGLVQLDAILSDPADSDAAVNTVRRLRQAVQAAEPQALVGGAPPPTSTPARPASATGP